MYTTEWHTPFFRALRKRYVSVIGSEYLRDGTHQGSVNLFGARHEDITHLSLDGESTDLICTNDVLEHVPDYRAALRECFRCLRRGGHIVITVPFLLGSYDTLVRARITADGRIEHLATPEFHNDPHDSRGVLCYYHFGWDFLDAMKAAGFAIPRLYLYWSYHRGYLGVPQYLLTAQKTQDLSISEIK